MQQDFTMLTISQVASQLNVKPATVRRWIKTGELPATNLRPFLIKYKDLNAFIEARMRKAR
jgi:excisionase family DNA binding protein